MSNNPIHSETPAEPLDRFDLAGLRVSQKFTETAGVRKLLTTVPVRRPSPQDFVRVSPDPAHRETLNLQVVVFFWPVTLPGPDGRQMEWHRSAAEAAELAMTKWTRLKANMSLGAYEMFVAEGAIADPVWPDLPYQELLRIAFRDNLITTLDHAVVKRLRGLI